jgi:hypothetical protein
MTTYALSRLSPFSLSLFGPSPPSLPKVPTLGELQKHAEILAEAVPTYTASPKPISRPSSSPGVSQRATQGPWFLGGTPPPSYSQEDPFDRAAKEEVDGRRLKKKIGWRRLGDGEGPRMQGGRGYATSEYDGIPGWELMRGDVKQPGIDDVEGEGREKSGWWRW